MLWINRRIGSRDSSNISPQPLTCAGARN